MIVEIKKLSSLATHPAKTTTGSAGMDLHACFASPKASVTVMPGCITLIPTGLAVAIPEGFELQIRGRSGLAYKGIITHTGCVDSDYRGEVKVILMNLTREPFTVNHGDRVAQLLMVKVENIKWFPVPELNPTQRGSGGFGHTGMNLKWVEDNE